MKNLSLSLLLLLLFTVIKCSLYYGPQFAGDVAGDGASVAADMEFDQEELDLAIKQAATLANQIGEKRKISDSLNGNENVGEKTDSVAIGAAEIEPTHLTDVTADNTATDADVAAALAKKAKRAEYNLAYRNKQKDKHVLNNWLH